MAIHHQSACHHDNNKPLVHDLFDFVFFSVENNILDFPYPGYIRKDIHAVAKTHTMKIEGYTLHNILQVTLMGYITRVTRREDKTDYAAKISHLDRILSNSAENPNVEQLVFERLQLHPHPHLLSTQETIVSGNKVINILPLA
ncbi:MAG: hypothetical protein K0U52_04825, partial [Gammaproteobacteria bacterium]|nr:hypothetical protein [Gammaproteobacteria bacterium]